MNPPDHSSLHRLLETPTRYLFFTGKGGVGKTSIASASAIRLADQGKRVLLVSTDPASNLDEVLGVALSSNPLAVPEVTGLDALNVDPAAAAAAYRERMVGPYRGKLPESVVQSMEEQFSGACTMEIAAFDEFSRILGEPLATEGYDHVVFDTAPTGHTLRLLTLPGAWTGFLNKSTTGNSCLGPLGGLEKQRSIYENALHSLSDGERTTLILVSRAQKAALVEAERTSKELAQIGIKNQSIVLNGLFENTDDDPLAKSLHERCSKALDEAEGFLSDIPVTKVPLQAHNLLGIGALRALTSQVTQENMLKPGDVDSTMPSTNSLSEIVDELETSGRGVVMTMGKGGVGKTTIAASVAIELARRGHQVHLSTTDPAAHIEAAAGEFRGLSVGRIDPKKETQVYVDHVLSTAGRDLDGNALALLEEDLRSPCTEEIAVFRAFARTVAQGQNGFVVLDTAPTGHTLLLLDATESYHREVARKASDMPEEVRYLLPRLRDASHTHVLVVTLPEATPVHEAAMLQEDLRRAQIEPFAWIINQSFANCESSNSLIQLRGRNEIQYIHEVVENLSKRTARVPWCKEELVGPEGLRQLFQVEDHAGSKI